MVSKLRVDTGPRSGLCACVGCLYISSDAGTIQVIYNRNLHKDLGRFLVVISIIYNYLEAIDPSGKNRRIWYRPAQVKDTRAI